MTIDGVILDNIQSVEIIQRRSGIIAWIKRLFKVKSGWEYIDITKNVKSIRSWHSFEQERIQ